MQQSSISPGWALLAILLLWGIAGAFDEPMEAAEPPDETPAYVAPPSLRLQCLLDTAERDAGVRPGAAPEGGNRVLLLTAADAPAKRLRSPTPPTALFCLVIDE